MPIQNGRYVSPTWNNNAPPAMDQTEMQAITDTLANLDAGTSGGGSGKRYASLVIGTSTNGWTTEDCDYLCDGIDDDVEFNSAISSISSSGGEIVVLSGTYLLSSPLPILTSISLTGSGNVTLKRQTTGGLYEAKYLVGVQNATISGIHFDGNAEIFQGGLSNVYEVASGPSSVIKNCQFSNFVYGAIYCAGGAMYPFPVIRNNFINGIGAFEGGTGIYIAQSQNMLIQQNTFFSVSTSIQSAPAGTGSNQYTKELSITNNYSDSITGSNMILDGISRSTISGNVCGSIQILNTGSIRLAGCSNVISGNIISPSGPGRNLIVLGNNTSYNLISGNNLGFNNLTAGIQDNGTNNTISNNISS